MKLFVCLSLLLFTAFVTAEQALLHRRSDEDRFRQTGYEEPGLWRPKWVLEREFVDQDGAVTHTDRIYLKLLPDRSVRVFSPRKRPALEIAKPRKAKAAQRKQSVELEDQTMNNRRLKKVQQAKMTMEEFVSVDGTWSWTRNTRNNAALLLMELKEGPTAERVRHEATIEFGKLDEYAAFFKNGRVLKYKGYKTGTNIPIGGYDAGTFTMRTNIHRPLVSKDFLAFQ